MLLIEELGPAGFARLKLAASIGKISVAELDEQEPVEVAFL